MMQQGQQRHRQPASPKTDADKAPDAGGGDVGSSGRETF